MTAASHYRALYVEPGAVVGGGVSVLKIALAAKDRQFMTFEKRCSRTEMYTEAEPLLSCSAFSFFSPSSILFFLCSRQKCNMHNFVCSLRRISAPVISIIIATTNVVDFSV